MKWIMTTFNIFADNDGLDEEWLFQMERGNDNPKKKKKNSNKLRVTRPHWHHHYHHSSLNPLKVGLMAKKDDW